VVDAIDDRDLQMSRDWDLTQWQYELVPWGVRFLRRQQERPGHAEVLAVLGRPGSDGEIHQCVVELPESSVVMVE